MNNAQQNEAGWNSQVESMKRFFVPEPRNIVLLTMADSPVRYLGVQTEEEKHPNDMVFGLNQSVFWYPNHVTHGIAIDDLEYDSHDYPGYVKKILSCKVPFLVSAVYPFCGDNFVEYPKELVANTLAMLIGPITYHWYCNTTVYFLALILTAIEHKIIKVPESLEIYGACLREKEAAPRLINPKEPDWHSYHGPRVQFEPGAEECAFLLGYMRGRYGLSFEIANGDPFLGLDRVPIFHGYKQPLYMPASKK